MYWKNANFSYKRWSIVTQLTTLYSIGVIAVLLFICSILYFTLKHSLDKHSEEFLYNQYQLIVNLLVHQSLNSPALQQEVVLEPKISKEQNYYVRILDGVKEGLLETPKMSQYINASLFPTLASTETVQVTRHSINKVPYVLLVGQVKAPNRTQPLLVHIALNTQKEANILKEYSYTLLGVLILGTGMIALLGVVLAYRSMRPIRKMTHIMGQMSSKQLHDRLISNNWPREFTVLAEKFNEMLARLENSFQRLTQFAADLAHELRTPIYNLKGEAEVCLSKDRTVEEYQHVLASSLEEYNHLSRIIDGLLFLARTEDPKTQIKQQTIDVATAIQPIIEFYTPVAEEKQITLQCLGTAMLKVDPLLFERAMHNVIANALKYTSDGGSVTVNVKSVVTGTKDPLVQIDITDTGVGIAAEHLPHIFTRFYRVDASRSKSSGGSGLGLAIVKSIMESHQGKVSIQSQIGLGTTVSLFFPY